MNPFDDLIARATAKLAMDGELKLEIARELRTHLEDSAAEYQTAGYAAERAAEEAVKHLGDPGELAEELWRANRGRLRVRAVIKWAAQILLVPAAVVVAVWVLHEPWMTFRQIYWLRHSKMFAEAGTVDAPPPSPTGFSRREVASLSADQRWVLLGDPKAKGDLEAAKSIVDRWPDNPVYYGDYANWALYEFVRQTRDGSADEARAWYLPLLERGEKIDPDNSYYGAARAAAILTGACEIEVPSTQASGSAKTSDGEPVFEPDVLKISDERAVEHALTELHKAVARPRYTSHAVDMARLRLDMLPPPVNLLECLHRQLYCVGILLPDLGTTRRMGRMAGGYAWLLAERGEVERAVAILHDVSLLGSMMAANGDTVIGVLVGQSIAKQAVEYQQQILERHSLPDRAERAAAEIAAMKRVFEHVEQTRNQTKSQSQYAGLVDRMFMAAIPVTNKTDTFGARRAEQALVESAGLGVLLVMLCVGLIVALLAGIVGVGLVKTGRSSPMLLVGWRRIGRVLAWSVLVPVAGYGIYIHLPIANREFGINYMPERFGVELLALAGAMLVVLRHQVRRAVAERAAEVGITLPAERWGWLGYARVGVLILLGAAVCAYVTAWQFEAMRPKWGEAGTRLQDAAAWLLVMMALALVLWGAGLLGRVVDRFVKDRALAVLLMRSAAPVLGAVVIVLGVGGKLTLRQAEAGALSHFRGAKDVWMMDEVDRSVYRELRDWHVRRLEELRKGETGDGE